MLDIDGFKPRNDTYGHPAGDAVLLHVAGILKDSIRASDIVGRYGGDEFLPILPDTSGEQALQLAEKLRLALAAEPSLAPGGERLPVHASFGVAAYPADGHDAESMIAAADADLYVSKRRGGDSVTAAGSGSPPAPPLR